MSNASSNSLQVRRMSYSALCLALALVLPFLTGQILQIGSALCPMHIPVLLCGFLCGWPWGLAVGFIAPLLRSVIFGMPPMIPTALAMAFELATYGALAGFLYRKFPKTIPGIYASLLIAMICGRLVWGVVRLILAGVQGNGFTFAMFLSGAITTAIPGIIAQLVLIPAIVYAMEKAGLNLNKA
ncbi:MAG: ECF transporter S component [Clostridia bacterium]|nr:ECF transporter S component [Clostridia bacterium]